MIVADSDVLIDYLRNRDPWAGRVEIELKSRSFATTVVSAFELWTGARSPRQTAAVELLLGAMQVLPLDIDSARRAAEVRRELAGRGQEIDMADCLIAGICIAHNGLLLTGNRKHFERIPNLRLGVS